MNTKPLLTSKTVITGGILFVLGRFLPPEMLESINQWLTTFEAESSISAVDLVIGLFVILRLMTKDAVDFFKWIDVKSIFDWFRGKSYMLLLPFMFFVVFASVSCQSIAGGTVLPGIPSIDTAPDGDLRTCTRLEGVGPVDLTICVDKAN